MVNETDPTPTFSIRREMDRMSPAECAVYTKKLLELDALLQQMSPYSMRDDSRLAYRFVKGELPNWSAQAVVHEMACMQCLCDTVPYQVYLQPFLRALATRLKHESGADWRQIWASVAEFGPDILKLHMLCEQNIGFPEFKSRDELGQ